MNDATRRFVEAGLGDFRVKAIAWSDSGEDLLITLRGPGTPTPREGTLVLTWVTDLVINMDFGVYRGMPLLFASRFEQLPNGGWVCELTFGAAPDGYIRCECIVVKLMEQGPGLP